MGLKKFLSKIIHMKYWKRKYRISNNGDVCWYCGGQLIWQSDFNYDEVHDERDGIVSFLTCSDCGAEVEYSQVFEDKNN